MAKNFESETAGTHVTVSIDVTKIVKYICLAGIAIVGIIFGTKCSKKILEDVE